MCGFISRSVNELLKIKDELTKERDDKLSEISKVRVFDFLFFTVQVFILSFTQPNKIHKKLINTNSETVQNFLCSSILGEKGVKASNLAPSGNHKTV